MHLHTVSSAFLSLGIFDIPFSVLPFVDCQLKLSNIFLVNELRNEFRIGAFASGPPYCKHSSIMLRTQGNKICVSFKNYETTKNTFNIKQQAETIALKCLNFRNKALERNRPAVKCVISPEHQVKYFTLFTFLQSCNRSKIP